jgi:DNA-binding transcriptional LysR family regulator
MLNSQWLETFTVLCETKHFTRAADKLAMTQPGVSQHLRKLEEHIGQLLISRQGKSFTPTPAGEAVFAMGLNRRAEEKYLQDAVLSDDPGNGEVVIACSGSFAMLLYPHLLPVMQSSPHLVIRLEAMPQDSVINGVMEGRIDLGVTDQKPIHPRLDAEHLGREELCLVLPIDTAPDPVSFDMLEDLGFIAHPDGYAYADECFSLNFPHEFKGSDRLRIRGFVNQISQIPSPIAQGVGYTLLPQSGVNSYPDKHRLRVESLQKSRQYDLSMIFRRGRILPKRVIGISHLIKSTAEDLSLM